MVCFNPLDRGISIWTIQLPDECHELKIEFQSPRSGHFHLDTFLSQMGIKVSTSFNPLDRGISIWTIRNTGEKPFHLKFQSPRSGHFHLDML